MGRLHGARNDPRNSLTRCVERPILIFTQEAPETQGEQGSPQQEGAERGLKPGRLVALSALLIVMLGHFFRDLALGPVCLLFSPHSLPTCHTSLKDSSITSPSGLCHLLLIPQSQLSLLQEALSDPQARLGLLCRS